MADSTAGEGKAIDLHQSQDGEEMPDRVELGGKKVR